MARDVKILGWIRSVLGGGLLLGLAAVVDMCSDPNLSRRTISTFGSGVGWATFGESDSEACALRSTDHSFLRVNKSVCAAERAWASE